MGVRTFNRAATSRRETATSPPAPSSQRNVFTRSKSQGQGPLYGQLSCALPFLFPSFFFPKTLSRCASFSMPPFGLGALVCP